MAEQGLISLNVGSLFSDGVKNEEVQRFIKELEFVNLYKNGKLLFTATKPKDKNERDDFIKRLILHQYQPRRNPSNHGEIYLRGGDIYHREKHTELKDLVTDAYSRVFHRTPVNEITACEKNVINNVRADAQLWNGVMKISKNLFWDSEEHTITKSPKKDCFLQLFDTPEGLSSKSITKVPEMDEETEELLVDTYNNYLNEHLRPNWDKQFVEFYKDLPLEFEFVKVWANPNSMDWIDRYWDMVIGVVVNFLFQKPEVLYILLGNSRGGKSTYIGMLHTIFGRNNTSMVRINDFSNPHQNNDLVHTCLNAPDEEVDEAMNPRTEATFKSLAAHDPIKLDVLFSSKPVELIPNFMHYSPSNAIPQFSVGGGTEAVMRRLRVMVFGADLSNMDNKQFNFAKETYTPEMMARFLGVIFALATFFSDPEHKMFFSPTMRQANQMVEESVNSSKLFYDDFTNVFDGYANFNILQAEYNNYCIEMGYEAESKNSLKQRFIKESSNRVNYNIGDGERIHAYRYVVTDDNGNRVGPEKEVLHNDLYVKGRAGGCSAMRLIKGGHSVVRQLNRQLEQEKEEIDEQLGFENLGV